MFVVAFLVDLMFGIDPTQVTYDHVELRPFLYQCLKNETFPSKFPRLKGTYSHSLPYDPLFISISIHCVCRMPYFDGDERSRYLQMAECDRCHNWYHRKCANIKRM